MSRFDPDTLTLGEERDRLATEYGETESDLEDMEAGSARAASKRQYLADLEQMGSEVAWLIDEYGEDATVTVRGLHAGEYAETENRTADANAKSTGSGGVPGTGKVIFAASGLVDAPWLGDGHPYIGDTLDAGSLDDRLTAFVGTAEDHGLPIGVRKWVEDLVSERTQASGNWRTSVEPSGAEDSTN